MPRKFEEGDLVIYIPDHAKDDPAQWEKGIVKSVQDEEHVFVVYHCNGLWSSYKNYTAARTETRNLIKGWRPKVLSKKAGVWYLMRMSTKQLEKMELKYKKRLDDGSSI